MPTPAFLPRSDADLKMEQQRLETERLRRSLSRFVRAAWSLVEGTRPLEWNWHIEAVCNHVQALADGTLGSKKLVINVPPRSSKSTVTTIMFPCWLWLQNPSLQIVFASYAFFLSKDHAYKRRAVLDSKWYRSQWGHLVKLAGDRNNILEIANEAKGIMLTRSVGSRATGIGGDFLILDDPNDAEQMESEVQRTAVLRWVDVDWSTRGNKPSETRELCIQQRTHEEDVTGHLIKQGGWMHLKIPMEFDPSRAMKTPIWSDPRINAGDLLDPIRFPRAFVEERKIRLGPYKYAGQYLQEPAPIGGGLIKDAWLKRWEKTPNDLISVMNGAYQFDPKNVFRFSTVDMAFTKDEIGQGKQDDPDYSVLAAWAVFRVAEGVIVTLLDLIRERIEGPDIIPRLKAFHEHWRFAVIGVESVQAQKALFQMMRRDGLPVREIARRKSPDVLYYIDGDKEARVIAATPLMASGRFFIPQYAPWLQEYCDELTRFPNGSHDDQVDVTAYAVAIAEQMSLAAYAVPKDDRERQRERTEVHGPPHDGDGKPPSPWDAIRVNRPW